MLEFKIFLLVLSFIAVQSNRKVPMRRFPSPVKKLPASLEPDFIHQLKLPNKAFCDKMESQSMDPIKILPWWSDYCERLRETQEKKRLKKGAIDLSPYRRLLDKVKAHRLKQKNSPKY